MTAGATSARELQKLWGRTEARAAHLETGGRWTRRLVLWLQNTKSNSGFYGDDAFLYIHAGEPYINGFLSKSTQVWGGGAGQGQVWSSSSDAPVLGSDAPLCRGAARWAFKVWGKHLKHSSCVGVTAADWQLSMKAF